MEKEIKERVKKAMKELDISVNALSNFRQLTRSTVNDQVNGNSKMGVATIEALLAFRQDLSAEWLLRGTGEMYLSNNITDTYGNDTKTIADNITPTTTHNIEKDTLLRQIELLQQRIKDKDAVIDTKNENIANLHNYIADLRHMLNLADKKQQ